MRKQSTLKELCYEYSEDELDCEPENQLATDCLVRIFDEFAIGFAEWSDDNYFRLGNTSIWSTSLDYEDGVVYQTKELLEIYKKEKGL